MNCAFTDVHTENPPKYFKISSFFSERKASETKKDLDFFVAFFILN